MGMLSDILNLPASQWSGNDAPPPLSFPDVSGVFSLPPSQWSAPSSPAPQAPAARPGRTLTIGDTGVDAGTVGPPPPDPSVNYPISPPMGLLNGYPSAPAAQAPAGPPLDLSPPSPQQAPSQAAVKAAAPNGSLLDRIGQMINDHPSTLLALGAGLSGAQNLGQGLSRGFAGAVPAMQQDIQLQRQNQTVEALKRRGVPTDIALAAASNPMIMSQLVANVFGAKQRQFTQVGEDMMGNKQYGFVDPVANKVYNLSGQELGAHNATDIGGPGFLAKGVEHLNNDLKGDEYLKQFSPEVQAAARDYHAGVSTPTGNPRKGFTQAVKMIAQKYGADIGVPVDDTIFAGRHKAVTGLASTTPGSLGGQMTYARTSLNHLADVAESAVDLDNSNGLGIAPLAKLFNSTRGLTTDQAGKVDKMNDKTLHYGQEITKYYAGSPGGEAERMSFQNKLGATNSKTQLASVLEAELELAQGKIGKTQSTIDEALYPGSKYQVMRGDEQKDVQRIQTAIARLRGQTASAAAPASAPAAQLAPGHYQWSPNGGLQLVQ